MAVLVAGGAGYIGSHTSVELLNAGYEIVVADNLYNSCDEVIERIKELTGKEFDFVNCDLTDINAVNKLFSNYPSIDSVIHFAAYKAVGESVKKPVEYYTNNIMSTLNLLDVMKKFKVNKFVFSSSATVYGNPATVPITEDFPLSATNPYGQTKLMIEQMLRDACVADENLKVALLRYFNPIGAHKSGRIGEDPSDIPNNLVPYIAQVAVGRLEQLSVFGNDYDTIDGTGVRDYIHVVDLALGHIAALKKLDNHDGVFFCNLGTGNGYSVLEVVAAYEKASGKTVSYKIMPRRPGDIASCYADTKKAKEELGWQATFGIEEMCADSWRWQSNNPNGYKG